MPQGTDDVRDEFKADPRAGGTRDAGPRAGSSMGRSA